MIPMKIILLQDEKKLGKKGDIIEASEGYARNYILPKKIGVEASFQKYERPEAPKSERRKSSTGEPGCGKSAGSGAGDQAGHGQDQSRRRRQEPSAPYPPRRSQLPARNSMASKSTRRKLQLPESLKNFGSYEVTVKLHPQVAAKLTVKVTEA